MGIESVSFPLADKSVDECVCDHEDLVELEIICGHSGKHVELVLVVGWDCVMLFFDG